MLAFAILSHLLADRTAGLLDAGLRGVMQSQCTLHVAAILSHLLGGVVTRHAKEVSFQLVSMNKSFVSKSMYAVTTSSVGNPFNIIDFNPERLSLIHI